MHMRLLRASSFKYVAFILFSMAFFGVHASEKNPPTLTLSASATIQKPSNEIQMKIGSITIGSTAEEALTENSICMEQVLYALRALHLTNEDYETCQFSINPTYTPYPKDPPLNWKPSINGYEVTNTLLIHTDKLELAGRIIDEANRAGANSITDIRFTLRNSRDYWTEALSAAGANAVRDAQAIASATGVKLIRILSITLNHTQIHSPQINLACMAKSATPIEPGEISITANVNLVYEIE